VRKGKRGSCKVEHWLLLAVMHHGCDGAVVAADWSGRWRERHQEECWVCLGGQMNASPGVQGGEVSGEFVAACARHF
jgi:hypothetical protein